VSRLEVGFPFLGGMMDTKDERIYIPQEVDELKKSWAKLEEQQQELMAKYLKASMPKPDAKREEEFIRKIGKEKDG